MKNKFCMQKNLSIFNERPEFIATTTQLERVCMHDRTIECKAWKLGDFEIFLFFRSF